MHDFYGITEMMESYCIMSFASPKKVLLALQVPAQQLPIFQCCDQSDALHPSLRAWLLLWTWHKLLIPKAPLYFAIPMRKGSTTTCQSFAANK
jgi:hypothetical protein